MIILNNLFEELKKTFYSARESKLEIGRSKHLSQSTPELLVREPDVIPTDVAYNFVLGGAVEYILAERNRLIKEWRSVTFLPEVDEAVQEICNESLVNENYELPFELNLDDLEVTEQLKKKIFDLHEKTLNLLDFKNKGSELFKQWYVDGVLNFECVYDNVHIKKGIQKIILLPPFDFFKIKNIKTGKVNFFINTSLSSESSSNSLPSLLQLQDSSEIRYEPEQITQVNSGVYSMDRLFSISHISKAMKVINQVQLIEDAIIIYRITRAPEKKVFYIDTGRLPKGKAEQYIQTLMSKHRNKSTYNVETGQLENRKKTVSLLEDYWLPRSADGRGTQIETLPGSGQDLGEIQDLEFFYKKLYRALNVPSQRRDPESRFSAVNSNNVEVENNEIKFNKFILQLRLKFNYLFLDLLKKELISTKTFTLDDWQKYNQNIKFVYKNNNDYAEAKKLMNIESKLNIATAATQLADEKIVTKQWIKEEILGFSEDTIKELDKQENEEKKKYPNEEEGGNRFN